MSRARRGARGVQGEPAPRSASPHTRTSLALHFTGLPNAKYRERQPHKHTHKRSHKRSSTSTAAQAQAQQPALGLRLRLAARVPALCGLRLPPRIHARAYRLRSAFCGQPVSRKRKPKRRLQARATSAGYKRRCTAVLVRAAPQLKAQKLKSSEAQKLNAQKHKSSKAQKPKSSKAEC